MAVCTTTAAAFTLLSSSPAASARTTAGHAIGKPAATPLANSALASFAAPITVFTANGPTVEVGGSPISPAGATATAPAPPPPPPPPVVVTDANSPYTRDWMCIRIHESGNQYNNPAEPSGAYGILVSTWHSFGYSGWPYQATPEVQDHLALELYSLYGFHPWSSRFACGL
jgi:hypothetical protein